MPLSVTEVDAVFAAAVELSSPAERAEYVRRVCGENAELGKRVEELLAAHFEAGDFLERPPATVLHRIDEEIHAAPGTVIGPYKLLQQIGEGGMGVVFMAEQNEPIQRTVALKIIKPGMDTRQVIARFEAERQALAVMDHPNIAKVLDAGTTEGGRPYFVMELVKGIPITKYCDDHKLSVRERLQLFNPVCEAVQHAHQKGIIHRDLKPTNVLVAEYDNHAVPKVIDFGVAKATAQKLTERTMFTEFGQVIGTVEYMSPEQAKFNQLDIDTRSDIYSLGVLLYELLTGSTPFERERLREAAFDEVLRIIREEEPPKPSTRLSASETLPSVAANRHTDPNKLSRNVSGELDWIVMKCLEKDRNRRYETANGLAREIERYLNDEHVQACPPSAAYRFRKFARRNKAALAATIAAIAVLMILVIGLAVSNRLIDAQRAEAETERQRAEENLLRARVAVRDILFEAALGRGEWSQVPESLHKKFAEKTTAFYESLLQAGSSSASLQYETAVGYRSLAVLHNSLKNIEKAEGFARQSIEILDRLPAEHPEVFEYRNQQAYSHYVLGSVLTHVKRKGVAEPAFQRSATLYESLISERPDALGCYSELMLCYDSLIKLQKSRGGTKDAEQTLERVLALQANLPPVAASAPLLSRIANLLENFGRPDQAIDAYRKATELGPNADTYANLGDMLRRWGKLKEALDSCHKAIKVDPQSSRAYTVMGNTLRQLNQLDEAVAACRKGIELAPDSGWPYVNLAIALRDQGKLDEAVAASRKGLELVPDYAIGRYELADILRRLGKLDEAVDECRKAIKIAPVNAQAHILLVDVLLAQGNRDEAIAASEKAIELQRNDPNTLNSLAWLLATANNLNHRAPQRAVELAKRAVELAPREANIWNTLGVAQYSAGQWQPAIDSLEKSMTLRKGGDASDWFFLAMAHWQLDHKDGARQWYDKAVEWMDKNAPKNEELLRFRAEAAELLGVTQTQSSDSSDQPQSTKVSSP
jgi:serine/threonine protein kinase/Flp pilus assembly protein TadD